MYWRITLRDDKEVRVEADTAEEALMLSRRNLREDALQKIESANRAELLAEEPVICLDRLV